MSFKLNHEGILLFEQPFIRVSIMYSSVRHPAHHGSQVPYENYRKVFRTSQKYVERELGAVQNASNELLKHADSNEDNGDMVKSLDAMIARVEGLKKKVWPARVILQHSSSSSNLLQAFRSPLQCRCSYSEGHQDSFGSVVSSGGHADTGRSEIP